MSTHALSTERRFKRLIRHRRRAADLWGRLVGAAVVHRRGHAYRLVPEKSFEEVMTTLRKIGGVDG